MNQKRKVKICLIVNVLLLSLIGSIIFFFDSNSKYFRIGPHEDFILISVKIDTYSRYFFLLFLITFVNITKILIEDLGTPILAFTIYNPDKQLIKEFTKSELRFYSSSLFLVNNLRYIFEIMLTISQIDIAIFSVFIEQLTGVYTINMLLKEKKFEENNIYENNL